MADPLSIAGSIAGLVALAGSLASLLNDFIQSTRNAPSVAATFYAEIQALEIVLRAAGRLFADDGDEELHNAEVLLVSDVQICLTACVLAFDRLSKELKSLDVGNGQMTLRQQLRWSLKEKDLRDILAILQTHKLTLSLMLSVLQQQDARRARAENQRLATMIDDFTNSEGSLAQQVRHLAEHSSSESEPSESTEQEPSVLQRRSFESVLRTTRVYGYHVWTQSAMSIDTALTGRTRWTALSQLSLSDISNIAVVNLPVCIRDLHEPGHYIIFDQRAEVTQIANSLTQLLGKGEFAEQRFSLDLFTLHNQQLPPSIRRIQNRPIVQITFMDQHPDTLWKAIIGAKIIDQSRFEVVFRSQIYKYL